ncbi:hypothetical protein N8Z24_00590 [bacterium]|nr:hypothetical protein [bacterium]
MKTNNKYPNYYQMSRQEAKAAYWDIEIKISLLAAKFTKGDKKKLVEYKDDLFLGPRISYLFWERVNVIQRLNYHKDAPKSNVIPLRSKR